MSPRRGFSGPGYGQHQNATADLRQTQHGCPWNAEMGWCSAPQLSFSHLLAAGTFLNVPSLTLSSFTLLLSLNGTGTLLQPKLSHPVYARCRDRPVSAIMPSANSKERGESKEPGVEMQAIDPEQGTDNPDMAGAHVPVKSMGTAYDQRDMRVMGKLQELRVRDVFN